MKKLLLLTLLFFVFEGIYKHSSKVPFSKKNLWKTGMITSILFTIMLGIIPWMIIIGRFNFSFEYPEEWEAVVFMVPFVFSYFIGELIFLDLIYERFGIFGEWYYHIISSLVFNAGLGALVGYVIGRFVPYKRITQENKDLQ